MCINKTYLPLYFIDNYIGLSPHFFLNVITLFWPHLSFLKLSSNFNDSHLTYLTVVNCNLISFMHTLMFICIQTAILLHFLYFTRKFAYIFNYHISHTFKNSNYSLSNPSLLTQFTFSKYNRYYSYLLGCKWI